jgi:hypothetical protein
LKVSTSPFVFSPPNVATGWPALSDGPALLTSTPLPHGRSLREPLGDRSPEAISLLSFEQAARVKAMEERGSPSRPYTRAPRPTNEPDQQGQIYNQKAKNEDFRKDVDHRSVAFIGLVYGVLSRSRAPVRGQIYEAALQCPFVLPSSLTAAFL